MLIVFIIIVSILLVLVIALLFLKNDPDYITRFLKDNPHRTSLYLIRNDEVLISYGEKKSMPLASTVKIIIALAYAEQVAGGSLLKTEMIDLDEINKFYLPGTDAGAHKHWLNGIGNKKLIENNSVALDEVAKGMISSGSNANAEYLIAKIGKENIEAVISKAGISDHTEIYPFVSSLIACSKDGSGDIIRQSWECHELLKAGDKNLLQTFKIPNLKIQKIWSDQLPASTTKDYCILMNNINTGKCFDKDVCLHVKEILSWPPLSKSIFNSFGIKGGSTAFIITESLFASDASGNNTALAVFFNDLKDWERIIIDWNLSKFELKILLDKKFTNIVVNKLTG